MGATMKLTVEIDGDNAAFEDDEETGGYEFEFVRILRLVAEAVEDGIDSISLFDTNGNKVGFMRIEHGG